MDAEKPTFILDLDDTFSSKPLPPNIGRRSRRGPSVKLPDYCPKFEPEFFDVVKDCAAYINRNNSVEERVTLNNRLNRIFILRDRASLMRLFRDLVNANIERGEKSGKSS